MDLRECYAAIGGNYDGVLGRLRSERLVQKFVLKFLDDPSYQNLLKALEEGNYEEAFRASHTIKGVCQNLDFTRLYESSHDLTEALRNGWSPEAEALLRRVTEDYDRTASAIRTLKADTGA